MDEAAERRIEERLAAHFGDKPPASTYDERGLQTWGTFFRDGPMGSEKPERPPSPYTDLFLTPLIAGNGQCEKDETTNIREEDPGTEAKDVSHHVGQKRARSASEEPATGSDERIAGEDEIVAGRAPSPDTGSAKESGGDSGESDEDDDDDEGDSSDDESSSPSDLEDELTRATSFRDQVADNERYRKQISETHAHPPPR